MRGALLPVLLLTLAVAGCITPAGEVVLDEESTTLPRARFEPIEITYDFEANREETHTVTFNLTEEHEGVIVLREVERTRESRIGATPDRMSLEETLEHPSGRVRSSMSSESPLTLRPWPEHLDGRGDARAGAEPGEWRFTVTGEGDFRVRYVITLEPPEQN